MADSQTGFTNTIKRGDWQYCDSLRSCFAVDSRCPVSLAKGEPDGVVPPVRHSFSPPLCVILATTHSPGAKVSEHPHRHIFYKSSRRKTQQLLSTTGKCEPAKATLHLANLAGRDVMTTTISKTRLYENYDLSASLHSIVKFANRKCI